MLYPNHQLNSEHFSRSGGHVFSSGATVDTVTGCPGMSRGIAPASRGSFSGVSNSHWIQRLKSSLSSPSLGTSLKNHRSFKPLLRLHRSPTSPSGFPALLPTLTSLKDSGMPASPPQCLLPGGGTDPATGAKPQTASHFS